VQAEHGYLDPSPYNEAGAGYYVCGMPGAQQSVLVMVRAWVRACAMPHVVGAPPCSLH